MFLLSPDQWEVKPTKFGKGVFAKADLSAGIVVGDYLGFLIPVKDEEKYDIKNEFYTMYYNDRASIFPDLKQDGIHRINHSCEPNCYMYTYKGRTLYFTLRRIFKGEELTISYLVDPMDKDCNPCTHICNCGSEWCSNTFHLSKEAHKLWSEFDDNRSKKTVFPRAKYGKMLDLLPSYPKTIADHSVYPLFGSSQKQGLVLQNSKLLTKKELRKLLRGTGRRLYFEKLGITVLGISDNHLLFRTESN